MSTFDLSPLFRTSVGFDRLMRTLQESAQWSEASNGYPPYNIEKTGDDRYRITVAVAGFSEAELAVQVHETVLTVEGKRRPERAGAFLYRGIAGRSFKRQFQLADHLQVVGAALDNGLLVVDLVREVPEAMKPRQIPIATTTPSPAGEPAPERIETGKQAA